MDFGLDLAIDFGQLAPIAALIGVSLLIVTIAMLVASPQRRILARADELSDDGAPAAADLSAEAGMFARLIQKVGAKLVPADDAKRTRLRNRLVHAGLYQPMAVYSFVVVRVLLTFGPAVFAVLAVLTAGLTMPFAILIAGIGGAFGTIVPSFWLDRRKSHRQLIMTQSLPDFLDLLVTCLESGLSLDAALRRVTAELRFAHPVLAQEMEYVQSEIDLGATADAAIVSLSDRTDMESIRTLATFLRQARQFGTSIAEALRAHADMLRTQREHRAEELAQKAAVKVLFPTLLLIFPAVFVVLAGPAVIQVNEKFQTTSSSNSTMKK